MVNCRCCTPPIVNKLHPAAVILKRFSTSPSPCWDGLQVASLPGSHMHVRPTHVEQASKQAGKPRLLQLRKATQPKHRACLHRPGMSPQAWKQRPVGTTTSTDSDLKVSMTPVLKKEPRKLAGADMRLPHCCLTPV